MDETFERLRREWIGSEASHIASPSEQLDEACSEAVIKGYHQGSVIRRACSRGPRDLRRVYAGRLAMFVIRVSKDALPFPTEADAARTIARLRPSGPVSIEPIP